VGGDVRRVCVATGGATGEGKTTASRPAGLVQGDAAGHSSAPPAATFLRRRRAKGATLRLVHKPQLRALFSSSSPTLLSQPDDAPPPPKQKYPLGPNPPRHIRSLTTLLFRVALDPRYLQRLHAPQAHPYPIRTSAAKNRATNSPRSAFAVLEPCRHALNPPVILRQ
jgi:hypothetical protein